MMGGMFIEKDENGKRRLVRGRKRDEEGVRVFDDGSSEWKRAISEWQVRELVKRLKRKRLVQSCLEELSDVEDPGVLERLEREGGIIAEAVAQKKEILRAEKMEEGFSAQ